METKNFSRLQSLESLSPDTMNIVLSFVTLSDFNNISLCSKLLKRAVSRASHLYMEDNNNNNHHDTSAHRRQAKTTTSIRLLDKEDRLYRLLNRFDNLTSLQLHGNFLASIGDHLFGLLNAAPAARTLQSLALHGAILTPLCHETLRLPHLKHLRLSGGSIRLDLAAMFGKGTNNDIIHHDHIISSSKSSESSSSSSSSSSLVEAPCPLRTSFMPTSSATSSCTQPPRLQSLNIAHCSSLRDKELCEMLHRVGGSNHNKNDNKKDYSTNDDDGLQSLSLHQCLRIKKPILRLPQLQHLSLFGCFALTQLPHFSCPKLLVLDLSYCFRLTSRRLDQLLVSGALPCLQELILVKCPSLDQQLQITSSSLRLLNISHCDSMTGVQLTCPRLETLHHDGCSSLHTLLIYQATSLDEIIASTLPALSRVEVTSPNAIRRLDFSNCKRLQSCSIQCPNLQHVNLTSSRTVALRFCKEVRWVWMQNWMRGSKLLMDNDNDNDDDNDSMVTNDEENDNKVDNKMARTTTTRSTATW